MQWSKRVWEHWGMFMSMHTCHEYAYKCIGHAHICIHMCTMHECASWMSYACADTWVDLPWMYMICTCECLPHLSVHVCTHECICHTCVWRGVHNCMGVHIWTCDCIHHVCMCINIASCTMNVCTGTPKLVENMAAWGDWVEGGTGASEALCLIYHSQDPYFPVCLGV